MRAKRTAKGLEPIGLHNACCGFLIKIRFQRVLYVENFLVLLTLSCANLAIIYKAVPPN
jgi:hypothetical protein